MLQTILTGVGALPGLAVSRMVRDLKEMNETLFRWPSARFRSWYYVAGGCLCGWLTIKSAHGGASDTAIAPVVGVLLAAVGYVLIAFLYRVGTIVCRGFLVFCRALLAFCRWVPLFLRAVADCFWAVVDFVSRIPPWFRSIWQSWSTLSWREKWVAIGKVACFGSWLGLGWFMWTVVAPLCKYVDWLMPGDRVSQFGIRIIISGYCSFLVLGLAYPVIFTCVQLLRDLRRRLSS